ncbi:sensor histidine kinase [Streptomyces sp. NBC_00576]|uniref:sensor histidine kinase n=1 Tax=Streptomyces sp. NBC_00576 TaxID=2903665 RepID=UPI002E7FDBD6|nr:sensor histidine kinase [Streptomyces sp. NBC_00576]WUB68671.1 sensor histidine kinase [Streptomyces sp. NBC_00576]WUB77026.1 sensor histidine kinase [Streptomyces sp. NBC_00576]
MTIPNPWAKVVLTVGLGVTFLAAIAIQAVALAETWGASSWVPGAAAAVVVCGLALMRHLRQTWTAVAGMFVAALAVLVPLLPGTQLPAGLGPSMALGLAVLIGSAVRVLPTVRAGAIAGTGLLLVVAQFAARPATAVSAIATASWLAAVGVGLSLRRLDERAKATAQQVRRVERLDLARELHDIVAHHITGMLIQAQAAQIVAQRDPRNVSDSLVEIETSGFEAMAAMRRVVGLLRDTDDAAPASPGSEGLSTLVERFSRQGPKVRLHTPDDDTEWPPEVTSTVYRIVQESLTNVLRHARHARSIDVTVGRDAEAVTVEVADDAPPNSARPHHRGGYGLIGMRERVETLGGSLSAGPRPGAGWSVRATLPVPTREPG